MLKFKTVAADKRKVGKGKKKKTLESEKGGGNASGCSGCPTQEVGPVALRLPWQLETRQLAAGDSTIEDAGAFGRALKDFSGGHPGRACVAA